MTETSSLVTTYPVASSYSVTTPLPAASVSPLPNGHVSPPVVEEEEYTIKCICGYNDDDGNTVFCEKCDTWQHIDCYYHAKTVPEIHFCTDCAPKGTFAEINADKARERQRRAREQLDGSGDRRVKRPTSKGQKKKHRDTITQPDQSNGWTNHDRHDSLPNGRDQPPPAKKPKTSHRATGSIASLNGDSRKRAHSNVQSYPSPSKSPQELYRHPLIPHYTSEFLELYDRDEGNTAAKNNEHTIRGSHKISQCMADPTLIATNLDSNQTDKTLFTKLDADWDTISLPSVSIDVKQSKEAEIDGRIPTWKLLKIQSDVRRNTIVGEIRGQIGMLEEYCQQLTGANRWKDLQHPDPFVFFHPHIEIYIDSRRTGTDFRYIRRSCDPNVTLRSFITPDDEVHHCFVAREDIPAGTELTATWYLPPHFLVNDAASDKEQLSFQDRCDYISRVLANFGDCACSLSKCRLDPFDRRSSSKALDPPKPLAGRKRKVKTKPVISPVGTGHATNSRAGSETIKGQEEEDDHRSTSGSSRNGALSRDLTPQGGALLDEPPVLGAGLTQREIRKIQALEKAQKEQSQKGEKKSKKRPSGASHANTPGSSAKANGDNKQYSRSPPPFKALKDVSNHSTPTRPSVKQQPRPIYVTASVQTDPEPFEQGPPLKKRKFCTPTQRLLKTLLLQRSRSRSSRTNSPDECRSKELASDVEMRDATTSVSVSPAAARHDTASFDDCVDLKPTVSASEPLPSQVAHTHQLHGVFKTPAPRLQLSTLPPVPTFTTESAHLGSSTSTTATQAATQTIAQSPGSLTIAAGGGLLGANSQQLTPGPTKKKLSLGDYLSRRKESATPSAEKPSFNLSSPSEGERQRSYSDSKSDAGACLSAIPAHNAASSNASKPDSTDNEVAVDDTAMTDVPIDHDLKQERQRSTSGNHAVSAEVQNVLSSLQQMQNKQTVGHS